jgi:hypothetical protein
MERARYAMEIIEHLLQKNYAGNIEEHRISIMGYDSLFPRDKSKGFCNDAPPIEVRVRVVVRGQNREIIAAILDDVDSLSITGPSNGGCHERLLNELVAVCSFLVPREDIRVSLVSEVA